MCFNLAVLENNISFVIQMKYLQYFPRINHMIDPDSPDRRIVFLFLLSYLTYLLGTHTYTTTNIDRKKLSSKKHFPKVVPKQGFRKCCVVDHHHDCPPPSFFPFCCLVYLDIVESASKKNIMNIFNTQIVSLLWSMILFEFVNRRMI